MRAQEFIVEEFQPKPATFADGTLKLSQHLMNRSGQREIPMANIMKSLQRLEALRGKDLRQLPPTSFVVKTPDGFELAIIKSQDINTKKITYVVATVRTRLTPAAGQRIIYLEDQVEENFADGKKPGRKGLAKRSGVNCKQSVTKLRSIAAHSSGERQRMAHWCANMKSGRKK